MAENPFKVGDVVVCVKPCESVMEEGSEWVVTGIGGQYVYFNNDPDSGWYADRFKLKEPDLPEFKPGDEVQCIRDKGMEHEITKGRVYRVRDCGDRHVHLEGVVPWVFKDRVQLVPKVPEPATNVHCGGPYVAVSEHSRVCVELANERASSGQVIQQLKDDLHILAKDHTALEKQRDQLQSELAHARAGGMSCCAPEWTPMEWTPLQRAEQPQQSQLDRWAEIALPAIIQVECGSHGISDNEVPGIVTMAYVVARAMMQKQCDMRWEE